jgi:hypothetical protein
MKKILGIVVLGLLLSGNAYAEYTKLFKGNFYQGKIKWQHLVYELPEGEWEFVHKNNFSLSTIQLNCIKFFQTENKIWKGEYSVCEINSGGKHTNYLGIYLAHAARKDKYDNCTLRPEYFYAKLWTRGMSMNCFRTRHLDVDKELNYPDDPETESTFYIKRYIKKNNLELPKTLLQAMHVFYSPSIRDKGIEIIHTINPELYGVPKTINGEETQSEYHRNNIKNYPIKKNFMINWTTKKASQHIVFEKYMKAKNYQKLNLSELVKKENNVLRNNVSENKDFTKQLKELNELFKSNVLTKEEFTKAKKKLLNK